jgi:hypothetical protein
MARCQTTHWTLDCGAGHGCALIEYSRSGKLAAWACYSRRMTGRPKLQDGQSSHLSMRTQFQLCCTDITRENLASELADLVPFKLSIAKGKGKQKVSYCATGTLREILQAVGLSEAV